MQNEICLLGTRLKEWCYLHLPRIVLILIAAWILIRIIKTLGQRILLLTSEEERAEKGERVKRAETLVKILNNTTSVFIAIIVTFMILKELGMDIGPLLAGAGILGLAIGFGAQSLVRDFLSGFFILLEDQYRVGDVIKIGEYAGTVEKLELRTTVIRDLEGVVHTIPNGEIKEVSNLTYGWSRVVLDIGITYQENVDRVIDILKEVGKKMREEMNYREMMIEDPIVLGVDDLAESKIILKMLAKTQPQKQWDVARELRRRIKYAFDKEGIETPFPHRIIITQGKKDKG
jgi:small-conductance mechanosensitive channel